MPSSMILSMRRRPVEAGEGASCRDGADWARCPRSSLRRGSQAVPRSGSFYPARCGDATRNRQIDPTVKEAPVIGNLTFDVLGCLPPLTQIVEVRFGDVGQ